MRNTIANVAAVIISNAKAALKLGTAEGNAREAVALGLHAFMQDNGATLDDAAKDFGAAQRERITAKAGADEALLKSAKDIFKVRLSEAKKMLEALAAGNADAAKYFNYDADGNHAPVDGMTATALLSALKSAKVEKDAGEGEGDASEGLTVDGFRAGLAGLLAGAKKSGILADAIAIMLEAAQTATAE